MAFLLTSSARGGASGQREERVYRALLTCVHPAWTSSQRPESALRGDRSLDIAAIRGLVQTVALPATPAESPHMSDEPTLPLEGYTIYDPTDPFENFAGPFYWKKLGDGTDHVILQSTDKHCNRQGFIHGGLLLTMMDFTFAVCAKEFPEQRLATISLNSEFVAPGRVGTLIEATGEIVRRTRGLCFMRGQITSCGETLLNASCIYKLFQPQP